MISSRKARDHDLSTALPIGAGLIGHSVGGSGGRPADARSRSAPERRVGSWTRLPDMAVKTAGIRHIHLLVADLGRSVRFYGDAFGMKEQFRDGDDLVFLNTPGTLDSLALHLVRGDERAGESGGYEHFGITVLDRDALDDAIVAIEAAGGALVDKGEHAPGVPYAVRARPRRLRHRDLTSASTAPAGRARAHSDVSFWSSLSLKSRTDLPLGRGERVSGCWCPWRW